MNEYPIKTYTEQKFHKVETDIKRLNQNDPTLTELNLRSNSPYLEYYLNNHILKRIGKALKKNTNLTILHLGSNIPFSWAQLIVGINGILGGLITNNSIKHLYLMGIGFEYDNIKLLAEVLGKNKSITRLTINSTRIDSPSHMIELLVKGLNKNTTLTRLDLGYNKIDDQGAKILADYLVKNKTLTRFSLERSLITDTGVKYLLKSLEKNINLVKFNLNYNRKLNIELIKKIKFFLKRNRKIPFKRHKLKILFSSLEQKGIFLPNEIKIMIFWKFVSLL